MSDLEQNHNNESGVGAWLKHSRLSIWPLIAMLSALIVLTYFAIERQNDAGAGQTWWRLFVRLSPSACMALVGYMIAHYFLSAQGRRRQESFAQLVSNKVNLDTSRRTGGVTSVRSRLSDVNWEQFFLQRNTPASQVTIIARYLDDWATDNRETLTAFFRNGGTLTLILPDPESLEIVTVAARQQAQRYQPDIAQTQRNILRTAGEFEATCDAAFSKDGVVTNDDAKNAKEAALKVVYVEEHLNYLCVRCDDDAIISSHHHTLHREARSPIIRFNLSVAPDVKAFLNQETRLLLKERNARGMAHEAIKSEYAEHRERTKAAVVESLNRDSSETVGETPAVVLPTPQADRD